MSEVDTAALQLAVEMYRSRWPEHAGDIDRWAAEYGAEYAAERASRCLQRSTLRLKLWCNAMPANIRNVDRPDLGRDPGRASIDGRYEAAALLRQMLALGISKWHPDPMAAIEAARRAA